MVLIVGIINRPRIPKDRHPCHSADSEEYHFSHSHPAKAQDLEFRLSRIVQLWLLSWLRDLKTQYVPENTLATETAEEYPDQRTKTWIHLNWIR
jgi:hypothetical protein